MLENHTKDNTSVKTEMNIRQEKPSKKILVDSLEPHNNHIIYEIDQFKRTISVAQFTSRKIVHWWEIINNTYKHQELLKKPNCIYVSSLNKTNLISKVKRKFDVDLSSYDYIAEKGVVGSHMKVKVMENIK